MKTIKPTEYCYNCDDEIKSHKLMHEDKAFCCVSFRKALMHPEKADLDNFLSEHEINN